MLAFNQRIPDFETKDINGNLFTNNDLKNSYSLIYFFPNVFSSTCTKQCEIIKEQYNHLKSFGVDVNIVGIADVSETELKDFVNKYELKGIFIADQDKSISKKFIITVENNKIKRSTFLLDRWTRLRKSYYEVEKENLENHITEMINDIKSIIDEDLTIDYNISFRRSWRSYSDKKIPEKELIRLIEAAHLAPSCFNNQSWRFQIITDKKILENIYTAIPEGNYWVKYAPALIAVYSTKDDDCVLSNNRDYYLFDTGMATGFLMLQATKMGLLTHAIAGFKPKKIKKMLDISEKATLITLITVGYYGNNEKLSNNHKTDEKSERDRNDLSNVFIIK